MIDLNHSRNLAVRPRAGCFHNLFLLPVLMAGLGLIPTGRVTAQSFTVLHSFTAGSGEVFNPIDSLTLSGNTLYGTTAVGGSSDNGTVFKVNADGTGFTNLYSFTKRSGSPSYTNSDGATPYAEVILSGTTLYGTTSAGGSSGNGTAFKVNVDGTGFTTLHSFTASPYYTNSDGAYPETGLVLSSNTLYGTARAGGSSGNGTVFKVNTDGTGFTNLFSFGSDGVENGPPAGLILSGNTLYGTTIYGGWGSGSVFKINTDDAGFLTLHNFTALSLTNSDGYGLYAGLMLSGNTLYGTAVQGGGSDNGTVFAVNTDGTGFTILHGFTALDTNTFTNIDGATPYAGLILSGNRLYGTTILGGSSGSGTAFAINTNGTGFTNLYSFTGIGYGRPQGGLILSGNTLYGRTRFGATGGGSVFSLSFTPQLTLIPSATNLILTWPTNYAGFDYTGFTLQSTTNLSSPVWTTNSPLPVVVNGQNTVTNPISGTQQFFRLSQ